MSTQPQDVNSVLIGGASGLLGSALTESWHGQHRVARLVRTSSGGSEGDVPWSPSEGTLQTSSVEGFDGVVLLSGEGVVSGRWTAAKKQKIMRSRVDSAGLLAQALASCARPPKVFVCASAIGYYGDTGQQTVDETAPLGRGFLAEVCEAWEAATRPAAEAGIRVVNMRIGLVLSPKGGALSAMLTPFKLGAGGVVGPGTQGMSWISMPDVVGAVNHILQTDSLRGPVNLTAPNPVDNRAFTKTLADVLSRPAVLPAPAFALRAALGRQMANETVLASAFVTPQRLLESGYAFQHPELEPALRAVLAD